MQIAGRFLDAAIIDNRRIDRLGERCIERPAAAEAPADILTTNVVRVGDEAPPAGLTADSMTASQRQLLEALVRVYIERLPEAVADVELARLQPAEMMAARFAWAGAEERGGPHYYRVQTTTFLAALRTSGMTAPLVVDRAINGDLFLAWVTQHLAPTLHENDVVIMDNLSAHKVAGMREAIESAGASDVLTAVQSGLEPDREHVFKVQVVLEISGRPNSRRLVENVRRFDRYVRGNRMLKLLPPLRAPL